MTISGMFFGDVGGKSLITLSSWRRAVGEVWSSQFDYFDPIIDRAMTEGILAVVFIWPRNDFDRG
jgi:hypothetical protein